MREKFDHTNFQQKTLDIINHANRIIAENMAQGYTLTIRQLHYQFVQLGLYKNTKHNYDKLIYVMDEGRKNGLVDWAAIEDRTRSLRAIENYPNPETFMRHMANYYAEDLWARQDVYGEQWIEKDALIGVIERPCNQFRVPYFACRGYPSTSELYTAGKRFAAAHEAGKRCIIWYLGDHDPSGVDMPRSNGEQVNLFGRLWDNVEVIRLGLNMDQIEEFELAPNYTKDGDSRTDGYIETFGTDECWELDALKPSYIGQLVTNAIEEVLDQDKFGEDLAKETANRKRYMQLIDNYGMAIRHIDYMDELGRYHEKVERGEAWT